jgi:cell division protein FtsB
MMLLVIAAIAPLRNLADQRAQLAQLRRQASQLTAQDAVLQTRVTQLSDPTYLEQLARRCLGMVRPGEIAFVTIPKRGAPVPPPGC